MDRGCLVNGKVESPIKNFDIPKAYDICLVYNRRSCGLNKVTWAPNFWLSTTRSALRVLNYNYYSVDLDLGEVFLSFPLHQDPQKFSGVDVTPYKSELGLNTSGSCWLHWSQTWMAWMGSRPSPYNAVLFYYMADEFM
jgi:hypothetical protein